VDEWASIPQAERPPASTVESRQRTRESRSAMLLNAGRTAALLKTNVMVARCEILNETAMLPMS
jgi:hypothetical protein